MKRNSPIKVLLVDTQENGSAARSLHDVLAGASGPPFQIRKLIWPKQSSPSEFLSASLEDFNAAAVFLLSETATLPVARKFLQTVQQQEACAAFAVPEDATPADALELLKLGVADLVFLPLTALTVLPRLWWALAKIERPLQADLTDGVPQFVGQSLSFLVTPLWGQPLNYKLAALSDQLSPASL